VTVLHEVLGLGRSGTTVVGRLVAAATGAVPVDELVMVWRRGFLEDRPCTCGVVFSSCPHWAAVCATEPQLLCADVAAQVDAHIRALAPPSVTARSLTSAGRARIAARTPQVFLEAHAALLAGLCSVSERPAVAASSKSPPLVWLLGQVPGVEVRPVHVLRDPRAVAWSWQHPHTSEAGEAPLPSTSAVRAAGAWMVVNLAADAVGRALGGAPLLRLEDLARDPDTLSSALGASDAGSAPLVAAHTMAGNPGVRRSAATPVVRLDERWRREDAGSRALVTALTAPLLWRYGYVGEVR
jgi:hypothetical protein